MCLLGVVLLMLPRGAQTQEADLLSREEYGEGIPEILRFFAPFLLPKLMQDAYRLKEYIRSDSFARVRAFRGDRAAVDDIFHQSMILSWGNTYEALFLSFVGTMDHRRFGVRLPVLGPLLWFPLTSEFEDEFGARVNALPRLLYDDSPEEGDRDKLQHFFGSAFITYTFESSESAERIGDFVERGEELFVVDGVLDERDTRANRQGQAFGVKLLRGLPARPSDCLDDWEVQ
ncbi:MAG: hypothetical protein OEM41_01170 [Ignavibacteria bacterium]|nr:hypothetical protein [Ignavibacteria bacterium]